MLAMSKSTTHPTHYWFRCNVKARMLRERLDQGELAERAGISRSHLNQVLTGRRPLSLETMERVSLAFGILDFREFLRKPKNL